MVVELAEKLFYQDPYLKEFKAEVVEVDGERVVLNRTAFFPFSGGQAGDTGAIGKCEVKNTVYREEEIVHIVEPCAINKGDEVECRIDWKRRYRVMKLHTAAHLVYEFFVKKAGKKKVIGSNISGSKARLDFEIDRNISGLLPEIEEQVNNFIAQGHDVRTWEDPEKQGFRWWGCEDMKMPCGGTHVKNTSEIGRVLLKRNNIGSGKERIEVRLG